MPSSQPKLSLYVCAVTALAFVLVMLPPFIEYIDGDLLFQFTMMRCFADQFWQGDLYPRWCFQANDGLGAPAFILYFPAAFYLMAFVYPLHWIGITLYDIYILLLLLATVVTFVTAYVWLRDIVDTRTAWMAALVYLFVPYRIEVMYYRVAYAEVWALAILPIIFLYLRRLAQGKAVWLQYGLAFAALILTHIPLSVMAGIFSLAYLVMMRVKQSVFRQWLMGSFFASALTAFYTVPAGYYKSFVFKERLLTGEVWPNYFFSMDNAFLKHQLQLYITIILSVAVLLVLSIRVVRARKRVQDVFITREIVAMAGVFFLAVFLFFPISKPFYEMAQPWSQWVFPWRAQAAFVVCFSYFIAIILQFCLSEKQRKTNAADFVVLVCFMSLVSWLNILPSTDTEKNEGALHMQHTAIPTEEYRTIWMNRMALQLSTIEKHASDLPPRAQFIDGSGTAEVVEWGWKAIALHVKTSKPGRIRLDHHYFPVWHVVSPETPGVKLTPETGTGKMLLEVPAGEMFVRIVPSIAAPSPLLLYGAIAMSLISALGAAGLRYHAKRV